MTARKDFMLYPTGRGLAATRRPFGDAHLPVWHSIGTRISSHFQTTQKQSVNFKRRLDMVKVNKGILDFSYLEILLFHLESKETI